MLVALSLFVLAVAVARNHSPAELRSWPHCLGACLLVGRWLLRDFRAHPPASRLRLLTRARLRLRQTNGQRVP